MKSTVKLYLPVICLLILVCSAPLLALNPEETEKAQAVSTDEKSGMPIDNVQKERVDSTEIAPGQENVPGSQPAGEELGSPRDNAQAEQLDKAPDEGKDSSAANVQPSLQEELSPELPPAPKDERLNTGQDFTRPLLRVELLDQYLDMAGDAWSNSFTLRIGVPFDLNKGWKVALRAELPYIWTDGETARNTDGGSLKGFGELFTEALFIAPPRGRCTYVLGTQFIFPNASEDEFGTGRYQLVPTAGFKYDLGSWMPGAWCALIARQAFDVAGYSGYSHINQTIIQPMLNIDLPESWFLTFAPECRYDWKENDAFIPFDMTVGRLVTEKMVVSFEYKSAINDEMLLYVNEFDLRVGYFF